MSVPAIVCLVSAPTHVGTEALTVDGAGNQYDGNCCWNIAFQVLLIVDALDRRRLNLIYLTRAKRRFGFSL